MKLMRTLFASILLTCAGVAFAASSPNPMVMLKNITGNLLSSLSKNQVKLRANPTYVYSIVNRILLPKVDVQVMSMTVLGRNGWYRATPSQRTQFTKAFTTTVVKTYASALNAYTNETIKFYPIRGGYQGRTVLQVNSQILRPDGPPVPVSYSLVLRNGNWKVYDLNVEGISLLQSFRSQFASQLAQGYSVAKIIQTLKSHNAKMK
jgi:phospholipid transport system substrate-binding protein